MNSQKITTQIKAFTLSEKNQLAQKWQALELSANCSVFVSWLWIGPWLELVTGKIFLVEAWQDEQVVGLALFVEKTRKLFGLFTIKQWHLHRTGNTQQDQIWIEHNDFLLKSSIADEVRKQMVLAISRYVDTVQEFVVGLSFSQTIEQFSHCFSHGREIFQTKGYAVDLRNINHDYLDEVPSKNTRSQIKRSNKLLAQQGELNLNVITDTDKIPALFNDIAELHIARWGNTDEGSGFTNGLFTTFHQQLVQNANTVQVSVLSLDNKALGYLVNFVYKQQVYFYLSAVTKFDNSKIKVGLTLHAFAIQHYFQQGMTSYDFLGGEAQYKQSLSNQHYQLGMFSFYQKNMPLQIESKLKDFKTMCKEVLSK